MNIFRKNPQNKRKNILNFLNHVSGRKVVHKKIYYQNSPRFILTMNPFGPFLSPPPHFFKFNQIYSSSQ